MKQRLYRSRVSSITDTQGSPIEDYQEVINHCAVLPGFSWVSCTCSRGIASWGYWYGSCLTTKQKPALLSILANKTLDLIDMEVTSSRRGAVSLERILLTAWFLKWSHQWRSWNKTLITFVQTLRIILLQHILGLLLDIIHYTNAFQKWFALGLNLNLYFPG